MRPWVTIGQLEEHYFLKNSALKLVGEKKGSESAVSNNIYLLIKQLVKLSIKLFDDFSSIAFV